MCCIPFESSVILDSSKTNNQVYSTLCSFESSVILDSSKTAFTECECESGFESSVILSNVYVFNFTLIFISFVFFPLICKL